MKKIIKLLIACCFAVTVTGCCTTSDNGTYNHNKNYQETYKQCHNHNCANKTHKHSKKMFAKMYTRNNHGEASEIGYVKFYDIDNGVKMVVNVDKLRDGIDYTTKIYQCKDAKCMNPDTCCKETTMALEMPLTRKNKNNPMLQETFIIQDVNTNQLQGATVFFERDNGYRAAWGFLD